MSHILKKFKVVTVVIQSTALVIRINISEDINCNPEGSTVFF